MQLTSFNDTNVTQKLFWEVSNPKSKSYGMSLFYHLFLILQSGNYLTKEDITEIISPSAQTIRKVSKWLVDHNVANIGMLL